MSSPGEQDVDDASLDGASCHAPPAATWMSGRWGIAFRIKAGDNRFTRNFDVPKLAGQISSIPGLGYVLLCLSDNANGDRYIAPHSVLRELNPRSCPRRDLFGELASAFRAAGLKVRQK